MCLSKCAELTQVLTQSMYTFGFCLESETLVRKSYPSCRLVLSSAQVSRKIKNSKMVRVVLLLLRQPVTKIRFFYAWYRLYFFCLGSSVPLKLFSSFKLCKWGSLWRFVLYYFCSDSMILEDPMIIRFLSEQRLKTDSRQDKDVMVWKLITWDTDGQMCNLYKRKVYLWIWYSVGS